MNKSKNTSKEKFKNPRKIPKQEILRKISKAPGKTTLIFRVIRFYVLLTHLSLFLGAQLFSQFFGTSCLLLPSPLGGHRRPPEVFGISGCPFAAGHLSRASWMEFWGSWGLLGVSWGALGVSWGALGTLLEPLGVLLGWSWGCPGRSWGLSSWWHLFDMFLPSFSRFSEHWRIFSLSFSEHVLVIFR